MNKLSRYVLILIASLGLAACESVEPGLEKLDKTFLKRDPQTLIDAGAVRLTGAEAKTRLSGNTELWSEGSVYYDPDGTLALVWHKIKSTGSWKIAEDGEVCLTTQTWESCHHYLSLDGEVTTVLKGKTRGVQQVRSGRHPL